MVGGGQLTDLATVGNWSSGRRRQHSTRRPKCGGGESQYTHDFVQVHDGRVGANPVDCPDGGRVGGILKNLVVSGGRHGWGVEEEGGCGGEAGFTV